MDTIDELFSYTVHNGKGKPTNYKKYTLKQIKNALYYEYNC